MSLAIIIINFRTPMVTLDCLRSLAQVRDEAPGLHVVLVENGSGDDSAAILRQEIERAGWGTWITLLNSESNRGFAGGNNFGIRWAQQNLPPGTDFLLLNSDTLVKPDALRSCRGVMEAEPSIGMMTCAQTGRDEKLQSIARMFPTPLKQTLYSLGLPWRLPGLFGWANVNDLPADTLTRKRDCEWIIGAFMYIRRAALDRVGLLDEDFFFYGEDIEFCFRFRKAGYRVHYDPAASIIHLGGVSSDAARVATVTRSKYFWSARYLVQRKCYGRLAAAWVRLVDLMIYSLLKLKLLCLGRRHSEKYRAVSGNLSILMSRLGPAG